MSLLIEWNICTGTSASKTLLELVNMVILKKYPKLFFVAISFLMPFPSTPFNHFNSGIAPQFEVPSWLCSPERSKRKMEDSIQEKGQLCGHLICKLKGNVFYQSIMREMPFGEHYQRKVSSRYCVCMHLFICRQVANKYIQPATSFKVFSFPCLFAEDLYPVPLPFPVSKHISNRKSLVQQQKNHVECLS